MATHHHNDDSNPIKPTDLRGILKYVPKFQGQTFVIAVDGSIVVDEAFENILLDVAVLRSLQIRVVLVFGIGHQLNTLAEERSTALSDLYGIGKVDESTLQLASLAAGSVAHRIMKGLTQNRLKCAQTNAVRAAPVGVIKGIDQRFLGKVDRIDEQQLQNLLDDGMVPVLSPIAFDRFGESYRMDSDQLAVQAALATGASKIIFLTPWKGLELEQHFYQALGAAELKKLLDQKKSDIEPTVYRKGKAALTALDSGVSRVHIIDGRLHDGLLTELFSSVGVGSLFYGNEYQQIRWARRRDASSIYQITRQAAQREELADRTFKAVEEHIESYFMYEIDGYILGCACLIEYPEENLFEVASVYVKPSQAKRGIGKKLIQFAEQETRNRGGKALMALSTQAFTFFTQICGFTESTDAALPASRLTSLKASGRNSRVLVKEL